MNNRIKSIITVLLALQVTANAKMISFDKKLNDTVIMVTTPTEGVRSEAILENSRLVMTYKIIKPNSDDQLSSASISIPVNANHVISGAEYDFTTPKKDAFILTLLVRNENKKMSKHPRIVMTITRDGIVYDDVLIDFGLTKKESLNFGLEIPKQVHISIKKIIN